MADPLDPQQEFANLTRGQWDDFVTRYRPVEQELLTKINADPEGEAQGAGQLAQRGLMHARSAFQRGLAGRGAGLSTAQQATADRAFALQQGLAGDSTANRTRQSLIDRNNQLRMGLLNVGKSVSDSATNGLGSAAQMAANRVAANNALRANRDAENTQLAATAAGLMIAAL